MLEFGLLHIGRNFFEDLELGKLLFGDIQPAQPLPFVAARPDRRIAPPQAPNLLVPIPVIKRSLDEIFQLLRQHVALGIKTHARTPAVLPVASSNCLNASAKSFTPSTTSFSGTSFMEIPAFSSASMVLAASSRFSVKLARTRPWSRNASTVAGGRGSTVSAPLRS